MRVRVFLFLMLAASGAWAKVHFINRGIRYHIGDNRYEASEDREFVGAYPVVGQEWIQAFKVDVFDTVKVAIANVRGVDDCPYCKVIVGIDEHDMGRLTQANNREAFNTLQPLAMRVYPGVTYKIRIVSYGDSKVDDFIIEGVSVETAIAEVTFLKPGPILKMPEDPLPVFSEAPAEESGAVCPGLREQKEWILAAGKQKDRLELAPGEHGFLESGELAELAAGQFVEYLFQAAPLGDADQVSRSLELMAGQGDQGWILTLDQGGRGAHGNLRVGGEYRSASFRADALRPGQWNRVRISYCRDGSLRMSLNGAEAGQILSANKPAKLALKALGLKATVGSPANFR